jgi:hypothetical protein
VCLQQTNKPLARYTNLLLEVYVLAAKTPEAAAKLIASVAAMNESVRKRVTTVKLGDEIGIKGMLNDTTFAQWCQQQVCLFVFVCLFLFVYMFVLISSAVRFFRYDRCADSSPTAIPYYLHHAFAIELVCSEVSVRFRLSPIQQHVWRSCAKLTWRFFST